MKFPTDKYFEKYLLFHFGLLILAIILLGVVCFFLWKQINLQSIVDSSLQTQIINLQNQAFKQNSNQSDSASSLASKEAIGQVYRNEVYGFEVTYPEQWTPKDTLPKTKQDTIANQNVEFLNNPFPTSMTKFVLWPNPLGFGVEFCNVSYKINSNGLRVTSVAKGEDQCSAEYKGNHPSDETALMEKCSDGIRYACFRIEGMNNGNNYFGYLQSDSTGQHAIPESDADLLLKKILLSFKTF